MHVAIKNFLASMLAEINLWKMHQIISTIFREDFKTKFTSQVKPQRCKMHNEEVERGIRFCLTLKRYCILSSVSQYMGA